MPSNLSQFQTIEQTSTEEALEAFNDPADMEEWAELRLEISDCLEHFSGNVAILNGMTKWEGDRYAEKRGFKDKRHMLKISEAYVEYFTKVGPVMDEFHAKTELIVNSIFEAQAKQRAEAANKSTGE